MTNQSVGPATTNPPPGLRTTCPCRAVPACTAVIQSSFRRT